jgi:hypothetical protein
MKCYRCYADYWDHAWFRSGKRGQELEVIQCAFCGILEVVPRRADRDVPAASATSDTTAFVFDSGRFAGKTISEVIAHPSGRDYLEWARGQRESWKPAIDAFLNNAAPSA